MNFPENLKYTKDHEWVRIEGNEAYIGITDFAQSELGDIVFVEIETEEEALEKEEVFGTIEAVKTVSDLFMPICLFLLKLKLLDMRDCDLVSAPVEAVFRKDTGMHHSEYESRK